MINIQNIQWFLRSMITQVVQPGDTVVDGTAGNGKDTLFLAQLVGTIGEVYAFDIQEQSIANTHKLLEQANARQQVKLYQLSHEFIDQIVTKPIAAAMFNLGYLPGSDRSIVTTPESTVKAVLSTCRLLRQGGMIAITAYRGHPGGREETEQLVQALSKLSRDFTVLCGQFLNLSSTVPLWILVQKK